MRRVRSLCLPIIVLLALVSAASAETDASWGTQEALTAYLAGEKLVRPDSGPEYVRSEHFVVHYDTSGQPTARAYAESASVYAEYCWRIQIDSLGWIAPPPDGSRGGDSRYDIYIRNIGPDGRCTVESDYNNPYPDGAMSYIEIDIGHNWNLLRVVVAHEFNHASQFRYSYRERCWWYENSATWMEDVCYDEINQYTNYFTSNYNPLSQPELPVNHTGPTRPDTLYWYAGAIWPMFLHEYYNSGCPRRCWERMGEVAGENTLSGINDILANVYQSSLADALEKYAIGRYFTGARADTLYHFSESNLWPTSSVLWTHNTYPDSGNQRTRAPSGPGGANFIQLTSGTDSVLNVTFDGQDDAGWAASLVGYRSPQQSVEREIVLDANQRGTAGLAWVGNDHIALIPVVTQWTLPAPNITHTYQAVQFEREGWVYRYNGPGNGWDDAQSIVFGADGNLYAAGGSESSGTFSDFTVISLTPGGTLRWVYRYDGPGNGTDEAYSIVFGADGNLYAAGGSWGSGTHVDFTVISLTPTGAERWVYRYNGPGNDDDIAYSIAHGADGNVYAAGWSRGSGTDYDFAVISLTPTGAERWVRRYNGPGNSADRANSLVYGADGNVYAAGGSIGTHWWDFTVISLTPGGSERWVYRHNGPGNSEDQAYSIVYGADGNLYAAGTSVDSTSYDFTVISLTPGGSERWVYRYSSPGTVSEWATSLVYGADGNVFAAGRSGGGYDFTVISLTPGGSERWVYHYPSHSYDLANSIVFGADSNLYAAGVSWGGDFAVISLTSTGAERWVYQYSGPGNGSDDALSIVFGADGNVYAAGYSQGIGTSGDFMVISPTGSQTQPRIWTIPRYFNVTILQNQIKDTILKIFNNGDANLVWSLAENPPVGWLSENPTSGTVEPNNQMDATLSFNTAGLTPGVYHTNLVITSNDPDQPEKVVSVELRIPGVVGVGEFAERRILLNAFALEHSLPNPFGPRTVIRYAVPRDCDARLGIYNAAGILVRSLRAGAERAGFHSVIWNGQDERGKEVPNGIYFCTFKAGDFTAARKIVKVK